VAHPSRGLRSLGSYDPTLKHFLLLSFSNR
jgi:hypothetical protein